MLFFRRSSRKRIASVAFDPDDESPKRRKIQNDGKIFGFDKFEEIDNWVNEPDRFEAPGVWDELDHFESPAIDYFFRFRSSMIEKEKEFEPEFDDDFDEVDVWDELDCIESPSIDSLFHSQSIDEKKKEFESEFANEYVIKRFVFYLI